MTMQPPAGPVAGGEREGWCARLQLEIASRDGCSRVVDKRQLGPLTIQRPFYPEGPPCHLYLLHPPGGVVGGDRLDIEVRVQAGAHALVTTPGATKLYRSAGPRAIQRQSLTVAAGGVLEWFPHESILFSGAVCSLRTQVEIAGDARFIGWEIQCLGRPAVGERFRAGGADIALCLMRDARPLLMERLRLAGESTLDGPANLRGFAVCATLIAAGADADALATARRRVGDGVCHPVGVSLIDELLVVRALAPQVEPVARLFVDLWSALRPRLIGIEASPPRIWST